MHGLNHSTASDALGLKPILFADTRIPYWPSLKLGTGWAGTDQRSNLQARKISRILTILLFYSISTLPTLQKLDEGAITINEQHELSTVQP